ncbi:MAG TPA: hypothetical protein VFP84_22825, partial [Kofleriaceae bacterium]|nr:hypothetical protein [Kofleriaceae bacterium]
MMGPADEPQLAVASDGSLAALHDAGRIVLLELPAGAAFAEIAVDPDAAASEIAWVGAPPRLLVLSRYAAHSTVHMLDPVGPRSIAEIRLELPMRLAATVGSAALVTGPLGAAVLATTDSHVLVYPFATRSVPVAAGAAATQFVVALAGSIEEWDPQSRMPKRRLRLPRAAAITAVGGSERVVWMTTQQEPARIDVIPLVNRGQPRAHELPEPIARIVSHPRSDTVACLGAQTGRLYIVDLDGRHKPRTIGPEDIAAEDGELGVIADGAGFDALAMVAGRAPGVLVMQGGRALAIVPLAAARDEAAAIPAVAAAIAPRSEPAARVPRSDPALRVPPSVSAPEPDSALGDRDRAPSSSSSLGDLDRAPSSSLLGDRDRAPAPDSSLADLDRAPSSSSLADRDRAPPGSSLSDRDRAPSG